MFEQNYKSLFKKIRGDENSKEALKIKMQKELTIMSNATVKTKSKTSQYYKYGALAASVLIMATITINYLGNQNPNKGSTPPVANELPRKDGNTVLYSSLIFPESTPVDSPVSTNEIGGKIAPFTEDLLSESDLIIKGTIVDISFKDYQDAGSNQIDRQTVVYTVLMDKLYYSDTLFNEGDTITLENDLYTYTSLEGSLEKLSNNRQYILSIKQEDEKFNIIYPFAPQIEVTSDGKYLFPDHWPTLINESTKTVTIDTQEGINFPGEMKLREDSEFELDFQKLVYTYHN